jgi:acetyl-CoA carboxylase biotin carboxyl carrier protein
MRELFIRKLIKMVEQSEIDSLEVSSWGRSVKIMKSRPSTNGQAPPVASHAAAPAAHIRHEAPLPPAEPVQAPSTPAATAVRQITAPMVGTFYRKPAPDARPFVEAGDTVRVGQVVCIVEAMKLMNEIQSDVDGIVAEVLVEDGQPVEYGQPLFRLK